MKVFRTFSVLLAMLLAISCAKESFQPEPGDEPIQYVKISVKAGIDTTGQAETKSYMSVEDNEGIIKWSVGDYLILYNSSVRTEIPSKALTQADILDEGKHANFTFDIPSTKVDKYYSQDNFLYYGKYPVTWEDGEPYSISVDAVQQYAGADCFDDFENASFGYIKGGTISQGSPIQCDMHNVFGMLKVNISLSQFDDNTHIKSVRLTDRGKHYLSGNFRLNNVKSGSPDLQHDGTTTGGYTIEKRVNSDNFVEGAFYFLAPSGSLCTQNGFDIAIYTDKGLYGGKTVTGLGINGKPTLERSKVTPVKLSAFTPISVTPPTSDFSANTYIIPAVAGVYSIPAQYKGNGYQGDGTTGSAGSKSNLIKSSNSSQPLSAEIMWEGKLNGDALVTGNIVSNAVYYTSDNKGYISFHRTGAEGCALVAVKQGDTVLWSWLLWIGGVENGVWLYNSSNEQIVQIMDRNIGALTITGQNDPQSHGVAFQYGRKDAFMGARWSYPDQSTAYASFASIAPGTAIWCVQNDAASSFSLDYSILHPNIRACRSDGSWASDCPSWGGVNKDYPKSLYDPCPVGWRVLEKSKLQCVWTVSPTDGKITGMTGTVNSYTTSNVNYYSFTLTNNNNPVFFPATGKAENENNVGDVGQQVALWLSTSTNDNAKAEYLEMTVMSGELTPKFTSGNKRISMPVRCQKWEEPN